MPIFIMISDAKYSDHSIDGIVAYPDPLYRSD